MTSLEDHIKTITDTGQVVLTLGNLTNEDIGTGQKNKIYGINLTYDILTSSFTSYNAFEEGSEGPSKNSPQSPSNLSTVISLFDNSYNQKEENIAFTPSPAENRQYGFDINQAHYDVDLKFAGRKIDIICTELYNFANPLTGTMYEPTTIQSSLSIEYEPSVNSVSKIYLNYKDDKGQEHSVIIDNSSIIKGSKEDLKTINNLFHLPDLMGKIEDEVKDDLKIPYKNISNIIDYALKN